MYTTCLFCQADLGRNEAIEAFPVGRRLAYDQARGRLWVVCRKCERWNLTPQEERWEAMEQAERLYRGTRLRAATDNVGLARLKDGTELVRVGQPLRPEFAAWRYGDQFGRRRRRQILIAGGAIAALGGAAAAGVYAGVAVMSFGGLWSQALDRIVNGSPNTVVARIPTSREVLHVKRKHLSRTSIVPSEAGPFALQFNRPRGDVVLEGEEATRAAGLLFPATNRFGGSRDDVGRAVAVIEGAGGSEGLIAGVAARSGLTRGPASRSAWTGKRDKAGLLALDTITRLSIEMALHEEQERRAMQGELAPLEQAWREAEEIAAIADNLLLPDSVGARLDQLKAERSGRNSARAGAPSSPTTDSGAASSS